MLRIAHYSIVCVAIAISSTAAAEVFLTANVYDTPGLPGYRTYDITASSPVGFLNGFSFYEGLGGITGPLYQATPGVDLANAGGFAVDSLFAPDGALMDSHWLVPQNDGVYVGAKQSTNGLFGAYAFMGSSELHNSLRSMPLARLVTNAPDAVSLAGEFAVTRSWNDGTALGEILFSVNTLLSDITIGSAPVYNSFPDVPDDVLAERQQQLDAEADWQAQVAEQAQRREELRRIYEEQLATEQSRLEELARLVAELSQIPTEEITPGGDAGITLPLDPPSNGEEGLILTIEHPELGVVSPIPGWAGGEYFTIDLARGSEIDFLIDFTPVSYIDVVSMNSSLVLRTWAESFQTTNAHDSIAYDSDAMAFSALSLGAEANGTTATPEPGAGVLVMVAITAVSGVTRRG